MNNTTPHYTTLHYTTRNNIILLLFAEGYLSGVVGRE